MYPRELRYTSNHEWIRVDGGTGRVGITAYAQDQLGDVVYVELPAVGRRVRQHEPFGSVESVKAVSDLYAPVSGEVVAVNTALVDRPDAVNEDPHGAWLIEVALADPGELQALLDADGYQRALETPASGPDGGAADPAQR